MEYERTLIQVLDPPIPSFELRILLAMFGFYAPWIPFFEVQVLLLRCCLKQCPVVSTGESGTTQYTGGMYTKIDWLVFGPIHVCPNFRRSMWLKT